MFVRYSDLYTLVKTSRLSSLALVLALAASVLPVSCGRGRGKVIDVVYISAPQVFLRDRVAPVYNKVGIIKNAERVEVLDRDRRFLKVRTASGTEGWIEQRYTISEQTYERLQKLAQDNKEDPVQAIGTTRNDTNIHLEPERDAEHLYQLNQGTKVNILKRTSSEKQPSTAANSNTSKKDSDKPAMEDWWLVRDAENRTGWVLARMVDIDVPLDIAQYAEGQRIQAFFPLDEVQDGDKKIPEYLVVLSDPKDGMPFDYNQVRVFTWNVHRHRYETAYREHGLEGFFPVAVTHETFDKEGNLPVFILKARDGSGNLVDRKYKLNTPIVRRVLAPGEVPERKSTLRKTKRG